MKTIRAFVTLSFLLLTGISTASAQLRLGVKAGVDIVDHKIKSDILNTKNKLGFQVGPMIELNIPVLGLGVDAALQYGYKKYDVDEKRSNATISNYSYLSLPVNLKKRFGIVPGVVGIFISAGPYANLRLSGGDLKLKANDVYYKYKAKNVEMGVNAGLGVRLVGKIDIGLYHRYKLTDNYSEDKIHIGHIKDKKYQTWSVGATYFF